VITGQLVGVKNGKNVSSAKIFLAIGFKNRFPISLTVWSTDGWFLLKKSYLTGPEEL
jgi:hypothetical protein